jgi:hypothetical protein
MNLSYKGLLPADFATDSRVWIYQCTRLFTIPEALQAEDLLNQFVNGWQSHGTPVKGYVTIFFGQFIIIMADENATGVSGCSTDSSVRVIKEIEKLFGVTMFDRTSLAFVVKEKIQLLPLSQLQYAFDNKFIDAETIYFNNLVATKEELETKWLLPVKESWLAKKIALVTE